MRHTKEILVRRKIPNTNESLYIDEKYQLTNEEGSVFQTTYDTTSSGTGIDLTICGIRSVYDLRWLYMYSCLEYPSNINPLNIEFFPIPNGKRLSMFMARFKRPILVQKDYRIVPTYPTIAIDKTGQHILRLTTMKLVKLRKNSFGYFVISVYDGYIQNWRDIVVHRLVANAWVLKNQDNIHYAINHKDGDKLNCHADNLEWVTSSENNIHASITGLNPASRKCRLRNYLTGEILEFPAVTKMIAFLDPNSHWDCSLGYDSVTVLYGSLYELRLDGDPRPWYYDINKIYRNPGEINSLEISIKDQKICEVFLGLNSVIDYFQLESRELGDAIQELQNKLITKEVSYRYIDECLPIEIMELSTGIVKEYNSLLEAARLTYLSLDKVRSMLLSRGKRCFKGWRMRIKSTDAWYPITDCIFFRPHYLVIVTDKQTKKQSTYNSLREASDALKLARQTIQRLSKQSDKKYPFTIKLCDCSLQE